MSILPAALPRRDAFAALTGLASVPHAHAVRRVRAPWTGEVLATVGDGTAACVDAAMARARAVQPSWAGVPVGERAAVLRRVHRLVLDHREAVLDLMQAETGKARVHAFEEVVDVALTALYYARAAPGLLRDERRRGAVPVLTRVRVAHAPVGVVGIIAPWNYPFTLALSDTLAALVAGNAVVLKPAESTPLTALFGLALLRAAGLPEGVLQVVTGAGTTGEALARGADFVQFTGSTATGRRVAAIAAERLVGASMELGGKNAALVLADADLDAAANGVARALTANAGQLCLGAERVLVARPIFERFRDRLTARLEALRVGQGFDADIEMGALISPEHLARVDAHVRDAVSKGATVVTGGRALPHLGPTFYAPTLLSGVTDAMDAFASETFGPVASLAAFDTDDEAAGIANATEYGLHASLWTRDAARARRLAARLQVGTVSVNDPYTASWGSTDAPMGGMNASGLGRRHGAEGLLKFTEARAVAEQRVVPIAPLGSESGAAYIRRTARLVALMGGRVFGGSRGMDGEAGPVEGAG